MGAQPLAQWMLADEGLQLSDQVGIPPPRQVGGQAFLDRFETQLFESGDLPVGEVVEPMLRQHIPAPECQRLVQIGGCAFGVVATERHPRSLEETLEAPCVDRQRVDLQRIAGRPMMQRGFVPQSLTQAGDVLLQGLRPASRVRLAPQDLRQYVGRDRPWRAQHERHEEPPLLESIEANARSANIDL